MIQCHFKGGTLDVKTVQSEDQKENANLYLVVQSIFSCLKP